MELDRSQTEGKSPKDILVSLTTEQWEKLLIELAQDERYKESQTRKNLGILLLKLGIGDGSEASTELTTELIEGDGNRAHDESFDKTFALVTNQPDWFSELQQKA